jgi:multimeric flavodoxin WrbA
MKILLISGSPRKAGNTELLLDYAADFLKKKKIEIAKFYCSDNIINFCTGCESCITHNKCVINDDMTKLYDYFEKCKGIIIGSPVYYRNVTSQLKAIFDRTYAVRNIKPLANKIGGAISVGSGTGGGQCLTLTIIYNYFLSSGAICVPGELNGVSVQADKPGDVLIQKKRLTQVEILCQNVLNLIK